MNQRQAVAAHLRQHGGITDYQALVRYGCHQLRTRICELRQDGWRIETADDGWPGHYVLVQEPGQPPLQPTLPL
jgi:hypothetical protein